MKLSGSFDVSGGREEVYGFLTDPKRLVAALPDIESSTVEENGFTVDARVGVGPMRGTMKMRLEMIERAPNERAVYRGRGSGLGSTVDLTASFELRDGAGTGTTVDWSGDARIGGRLASVAGGLLEPLAKKNLERFVGAVREGIEGESGG
jgi:carbon monoxide dehydrogenase subunit G